MYTYLKNIFKQPLRREVFVFGIGISMGILLGVGTYAYAIIDVDGDLLPGEDGAVIIGDSIAKAILSVNEALYFDDAGRVGFGADLSAAGVAANGTYINGGIRLVTGKAKPACTVARRGLLWVLQNATGTDDGIELCANQNGSPTWRRLLP